MPFSGGWRNFRYNWAGRAFGAMDYQYLRVETVAKNDAHIAIVTLARPEKRNALSLDLMLELMYVLQELGSDPLIRIVILAAEGKVFSSGHDLSEMTRREESEYRKLFEVCTDLMLKLHAIPQPVIAEVQGLATAAGCQLVAACDLAIASESAFFATPGVRIGLFCSTPMVPLTRAIGRKRAMEMLLTGTAIDAKTAADWGLVNRVVAHGELRSTTLAIGYQIAEASSYTVALGKRTFYNQIDQDERAAYACSKSAMTENAMANDAQEGISAFLGKRAPVWSGK
jgi:enoyl-CoA hydratase/carnithine racemase